MGGKRRDTDPALTAIGAGEVQARGPDVIDDLADAPSRLAVVRGWTPGRRGGGKGGDVARRPPSHAVEVPEIGRQVRDHARDLQGPDAQPLRHDIRKGMW